MAHPIRHDNLLSARQPSQIASLTSELGRALRAVERKNRRALRDSRHGSTLHQPARQVKSEQQHGAGAGKPIHVTDRASISETARESTTGGSVSQRTYPREQRAVFAQVAYPSAWRHSPSQTKSPREKESDEGFVRDYASRVDGGAMWILASWNISLSSMVHMSDEIRDVL